MLMWSGPGMPEPVTIVGSGVVLEAAVAEGEPSANRERPGGTTQRVELRLAEVRRLTPPMRLVVRGLEMRVLGSVVGPPWAESTLVTCELVNSDLPDMVQIGTVVRGELDSATGTYPNFFTPVWTGPANIAGGSPVVVNSGGERAPLDKVEITLPLDAAASPGLQVRVVSARHPSVANGVYTIAGEIDSSTAEARTVVAYRPEGT